MRTLIYCSLFLIQFAGASPSIWEQLETGSVNPQKGVIKSVDVQGLDVYIKVIAKDEMGNSSERLDKLCRPNQSDWSEELRAAMFKSKVDMLEEARKSKKPIEFGTTGPFNSCVSFVRSVAD